MIAEVHQKIHGELNFKDAHIERESLLDAPLVFGVIIAVDHRNAELAQHPNARSGAPVYCRLQQWHKNQLRDNERKGGERHPWIDVDQIGENRAHDAGLQQRLRDTLTDKPADRLDLGDDHRDCNRLGFGGRGGGCRSLDDRMHPPAQIAFGPLADPAAVNIEYKLGTALDQHDAGIASAQPHDPGIGAVLDKVVDDPTLQFQRDDLEEGDDTRQHQQRQLMRRTGGEHIPVDIARQPAIGWRSEILEPARDARHAEIFRRGRARGKMIQVKPPVGLKFARLSGFSQTLRCCRQISG